MRHSIIVEALGHPEVKKYRTLIRLNHSPKLQHLNVNKMTYAVFFKTKYSIKHK